MNKAITGLISILVVFVMVPLHGWAATPKETVEAGVNNLLKTLGDPAFKAKPEDERISIIGAEIEKVFDFEELSRRTLGRDWKKMKPEQEKEFVQLFRELLQGVYADRLLAYSDQKIIFGKETMLKKGRAEVQSYLQTSDSKKIPLFYRLTDKSGSWKVYDVKIDNLILVSYYRSSFNAQIRKDGIDGLVKLLDEMNTKGQG